MDINYDDNLVDLILRLRVSKLITSRLVSLIRGDGERLL